MIAVIALLATGPRLAGRSAGPDDANDVVVKAAFLVKFVRFTTWPLLKAEAPLAMCVLADDSLVAALEEIVRTQSPGDHPIEVRRAPDRGTWSTCQVLYVGEGEGRRAAQLASTVRTAAVLTVSDAGGFAQTGIIELYLEGRRMKFAINIDAATRSGLHLSSQLLALAKIVRDEPTQ
ncbi:MAG: YfiR family protein [Vicinamibacterales bacterium]